ncbi:MAG: hypothetical protein ACMUHX_08830 [bacterium]
MRTFLIALLLILFIITPCFAKIHGTPYGQTPHEEDVCDAETGVAFGLCNAYCEAMDCDSENPHASEKACARIKSLYTKHTGNKYPPCEKDNKKPPGQTIYEPGCPCNDYIPEFAAFLENTSNFSYCYDTRNNNEIYLQIGDKDDVFITVNNLEALIPVCEYIDYNSGQSDNLEITDEEFVSCKNLLLKKIEEAELICDY